MKTNLSFLSPEGHLSPRSGILSPAGHASCREAACIPARVADDVKLAYDRAVDNRRSEWSSIYTAKKEGLAEGEAAATRKFVQNALRDGVSMAQIL
jgi:hypothetical protein